MKKSLIFLLALAPAAYAVLTIGQATQKFQAAVNTYLQNSTPDNAQRVLDQYNSDDNTDKYRRTFDSFLSTRNLTLDTLQSVAQGSTASAGSASGTPSSPVVLPTRTPSSTSLGVDNIRKLVYTYQSNPTVENQYAIADGLYQLNKPLEYNDLDEPTRDELFYALLKLYEDRKEKSIMTRLGSLLSLPEKIIESRIENAKKFTDDYNTQHGNPPFKTATTMKLEDAVNAYNKNQSRSNAQRVLDELAQIRPQKRAPVMEYLKEVAPTIEEAREKSGRKIIDRSKGLAEQLKTATENYARNKDAKNREAMLELLEVAQENLWLHGIVDQPLADYIAQERNTMSEAIQADERAKIPGKVYNYVTANLSDFLSQVGSYLGKTGTAIGSAIGGSAVVTYGMSKYDQFKTYIESFKKTKSSADALAAAKTLVEIRDATADAGAIDPQVEQLLENEGPTVKEALKMAKKTDEFKVDKTDEITEAEEKSIKSTLEKAETSLGQAVEIVVKSTFPSSVPPEKAAEMILDDPTDADPKLVQAAETQAEVVNTLQEKIQANEAQIAQNVTALAETDENLNTLNNGLVDAITQVEKENPKLVNATTKQLLDDKAKVIAAVIYGTAATMAVAYKLFPAAESYVRGKIPELTAALQDAQQKANKGLEKDIEATIENYKKMSKRLTKFKNAFDTKLTKANNLAGQGILELISVLEAKAEELNTSISKYKLQMIEDIIAFNDATIKYKTIQEGLFENLRDNRKAAWEKAVESVEKAQETVQKYLKNVERNIKRRANEILQARMAGDGFGQQQAEIKLQGLQTLKGEIELELKKLTNFKSSQAFNLNNIPKSLDKYVTEYLAKNKTLIESIETNKISLEAAKEALRKEFQANDILLIIKSMNEGAKKQIDIFRAFVDNTIQAAPEAQEAVMKQAQELLKRVKDNTTAAKNTTGEVAQQVAKNLGEQFSILKQKTTQLTVWARDAVKKLGAALMEPYVYTIPKRNPNDPGLMKKSVESLKKALTQSADTKAANAIIDQNYAAHLEKIKNAQEAAQAAQKAKQSTKTFLDLQAENLADLFKKPSVSERLNKALGGLERALQFVKKIR